MSLPLSLRLGLAAAALIVTGASAQAQFSGVKFLDISELFVLDNGGVSYAEVMAFSSTDGTGTNFALDSNLGSSPSTNFSGYGTVPEDAIDGNTDGNYFSGSVAHELDTNNQILDTYTVAFDTAQTIGSVNIFGRTDCCQERDGNDTTSNLQLTLRDAGGVVLHQQAFGIPNDDQQILLQTVPEPSALLLGGLGMAGLASLRRRRAV